MDKKRNLNIKQEKLVSSNQPGNSGEIKCLSIPASRHISDAISSSTEEDEDNRHIKRRENENLIANKNAMNIQKVSLYSSTRIDIPDNHQMSPLVSQTKLISNYSASQNLNVTNKPNNHRPTSSSQVELNHSTQGLTKVGGANSLTSSPRSSSLSHKKKTSGFSRANRVNQINSPAKGKVEYKSRSRTPDKAEKRHLRDSSLINITSEAKISNCTSKKQVVDDSCSERSSRCDESDDREEPSSADTESNLIQYSVEGNSRRNHRRVQTRKPRNARNKSAQSPEITNIKNSASARSISHSSPMNSTKVELVSAKMDATKQMLTHSKKQSTKISSAESAISKYAPEKYASDGSRADSVNMSPRKTNLASNKILSANGNVTTTRKRPTTSKTSNNKETVVTSERSTTRPLKNRPMSAMTHSSSNDKRPRANTLSSSIISDKPPRNNSSNTEIYNVKQSKQKPTVNVITKNSESQLAATIIQTQWRGHATRNIDPKVVELKEEVRSMRTEQHIRHLTKELSAAKTALEQERKLRALQMDAIKVLWKEVQLLDAHKNENPICSSGFSGLTSNINYRARPSGSNGSKISTRSSEHSIAKLMETLEATAGSGCGFRDTLTPTSNNIPESTSSLSLSTSTTANIPGSIKMPVSSDSPVPRYNQNNMAQSMPSSVLRAEFEANNFGTNDQPPQALDALNKTCSSLQNQVEQLQSSLTGVMQFMSAFSSLEVSEMAGNKIRTRHSSSTSTQETVSFPCNNNSVMNSSMRNPNTSDESMFLNQSSMVSDVNKENKLIKACSSLEVQTDQDILEGHAKQDGTAITSLQTKSNGSEATESKCSVAISACNIGHHNDNSHNRKNSTTQMNENTPDLIFKQSSTNSTCITQPADALGKFEASSHSIDSNLLQCSDSHRHLQKQEETNSDRAKSPRPKTLPGLNSNSKDKTLNSEVKSVNPPIPGLAQLAGNALLNSPQAPQQVKAFAKTLIEGLLTDSIVNNEEIEQMNETNRDLNKSNPTSGVVNECGIAACDDLTDVSLSLGTEAELHNDDMSK